MDRLSPAPSKSVAIAESVNVDIWCGGLSIRASHLSYFIATGDPLTSAHRA